ncbi:MAG: hypothetical protein AAFR79_18840 [Pseudomonadota bacterium]
MIGPIRVPLFAFFVVAAMAVLLHMPDAQAQTTDASSACHTALEAEYGVETVLDTFERNSSGRRWVHTDVRLQDGRSVSYRCLVSYGQVRRVDIHSGDWNEAPKIARIEDEPEDTEPQAAPEEDSPTRPRTYRVGLGEGYSPKDGVTCYRERRTCYDSENRLDLQTTKAEFP